MGVIFLLRPPTRPPSILTEFSENTTRTFWPFELSLCWWEAILFVVLSPQENKATASKIERIQLNVLYVIVHCSFCCTLLVRSVCVCVYSVYSVIVASWVFIFPFGDLCWFFYLEYNGDIPFSMRRGFLATYSHNNTAANITGAIILWYQSTLSFEKKKNNATSTGWHWSL